MSEHQQRSSDARREVRHEATGKAAGNTRSRPAGSAGPTGSSAGTAGQRSETARSPEATETPRSGVDCRPWFERQPAWLQCETDALRAAGIEYERDEEAFSQGILRLKLVVDFEGERLPLVVTYPDLYPFFRFEVTASTLSLPYHQHAVGKNLCLIGRGTHHWRTTDTVAGLLREQLPMVLRTGQSSDADSVRGLEQEQAEPFSDYYPYAPGMVVIDGAWKTPPDHDRGTFTIATIGQQGPPPARLVRGAMVELRGRNGESLFTADSAIYSAFPGDKLQGCWVRVPKPIEQFQQDLFLKEVLERSPFARRAPANRVDGGWLRIWAVAFPEEDKWRREDGEGWVFVCQFQANSPSATQKARSQRPSREAKKKQKGNRKGKR